MSFPGVRDVLHFGAPGFVALMIYPPSFDHVQRLLTVDEEEILHCIEALLDSNFTVSPALQNSIKEGLDDMKGGRVHPHSDAHKLYKKWLRE